MYRHAPAHVPSPEVRQVVTANVLLDELPVETRRVPWASVGVSLVVLACMVMLAWQHLSPATSARADRVQTSEVTTYTIEQAAQLGELMVLVGRLVGLTDTDQVHIFSINPGETALPGGVTLEDGSGNRVDAVPASEQIPARSMQHRVIEVDEDFDVRGPGFWMRNNPGKQGWE